MKVAGVGQATGGDDGVGLAVVRELRARGVPSGVELHEIPDPTALVDLLAGGGLVVVVDALAGPEPGEVLALTPEEVSERGLTPLSTHSVGVLQAIGLARALGETGSVRIVGIGIRPPEEPSEGLSPAVAAAIPRAAAAVLELLASNPVRLRVHVQGVVQGVGFRPFVFRIARKHDLAGWVRNGADGVRLEVQGSRAGTDAFLEDLRAQAPPRAVIARSDVEVAPGDPGLAGFTIRESAPAGPVRPSLPPDLATCADCAREIRDPRERRYRHPFASCTQCGPRYSIVGRLPYDRPNTAMSGFTPCEACSAEYHDPLDRRFHAQPIACPECGPRLRLLEPDGTTVASGDEALRLAAAALRAGRILAVKGVGGYQLMVLAGDPVAVARLRERKRRPAKPFAVMFPGAEALRACCEVSPEELDALQAPEAPILLLRRRPDPGAGTRSAACPDVARCAVCAAVAPDNPYLGGVLPCSPLHHLLLAEVGEPAVCTSGNLSDEPICTDDAEAMERLGRIADILLAHDRPVLRPVDDSVGRIGPRGLALLRRARGFTPLPLSLAGTGLPPVLALGAHQKATVAMLRDGEAVVSQHLGDMDSAAGVALLERTAREFSDLWGGRPAAIACDLHPDYASTRLAERLGVEWGLPVVRVQHHHAHVAAVLAEHGSAGEALGLAWDGTGYGTDGTVWGGEGLVCGGEAVRRVARLRPFPLPGGDLAARDPRRPALGLLAESFPEAAAELAGAWFPAGEGEVLLQAIRRGVNSPPGGSMGRLFDAVAAIAGVRAEPGFEGQAAMALEFAADRARSSRVAPYRLPLLPGDPATADWGPLAAELLDDRHRGAAPEQMARRFHLALAELAVTIARAAGLPRVALSGGCFQNPLLADLVAARLAAARFEVLTPRLFPPNDGAIALGQALVAARRLRQGDEIFREQGS